MTIRLNCCLLLAVLCTFAAQPMLADDAPTVAAEQASFRLADPNLAISAVAFEPAVASPVAVAWDEFGRLYVVEMTDYPADGSGGQVKRLEDRDGDGVYEHATLFAEKLAWPSGVLPYLGGILVTSAPNLLYFKDTDNDGKADVREVVLTGFGEGNQQLRVNSPTWGLDNWIYMANGRSGGAVRKPGDEPAKAVNIARNDLRYQPITGEIQAIAGFSQFGLPRNDWGDRFPSWNTVPIRHVVLENRNAAGTLQTGLVADILDLNDGGRLYSLAPSQKRFNAESVAYFNATCGPVINRDGGLGQSYIGDALVCEPLSSLVHRRKLIADGPTFKAVRVEQGREFLASAHPWFRPVNLANGPDGALYLVDFCRAWVEHPAFVPEKQRNSVDFREGHQRGRIWRIQDKNKVTGKNSRWPGALQSAELADLLEHENSWYRDTAQRLIVERNDQNAVETLRKIVGNSKKAVSVTQALWTLKGLSALSASVLKSAAQSPDTQVRRQAVRLLDFSQPENQPMLAGLANDPSALVRFELLRAQPGLGNENAIDAVISIASRDAGSPWGTAAILGSVGSNPMALISRMAKAQVAWLQSPDEPQAAFLARLAQHAASQQQGKAVIEILPEFSDPLIRIALVVGLTRATAAKRDELKRVILAQPERHQSLVSSAETVLQTKSRQAWAQPLAFEMLAGLAPDKSADFMTTQLGHNIPVRLQKTMAAQLPRLSRPALQRAIFAGWDSLPMAFRRDLVAQMVSSPGLAASLVEAVETASVPVAEIDPASRSLLLKQGDLALQARVAKLLSTSMPANRAEVLKRYEPALELSGVVTRGQALFEKNCISCHAHRGTGAKVGPDLAGVAGKLPEELLVSILDPARDASPDGIGVVVLTNDGRTLSGILAEENAEMVRLRQAEGREENIPRADVELVRSTGKSLMPEGLEAVLKPQDLADLIAFLRDVSAAHK